MHIWVNVLLTVSPRVVTIMYMQYTYLCVYIPDTVSYFRAASTVTGEFILCMLWLFVAGLDTDGGRWSWPSYM